MQSFIRCLVTVGCVCWVALYASAGTAQSEELGTQVEGVVDGEVAGEPGAETADGEAPAALPNGAIYIPLQPSFVVNFGGPGRLKYIKADISVRLQDAAAASSVRHHMPYIRNNLVLLFSAQTAESISSQDGKEALRKEALQQVREVIMEEDQQEGVVDLYFNAFVVQQ